MTKEPVEWKPEIWPIDHDRLGDIHYAEEAVKSLYGSVSAYLGPFVARQIFNLYAPPLKPREMQFYENVKLYWQLLSMEAPNAAQLAKRLTQNGSAQEAKRKQIERARTNKKVRECLREMLFELGADDDYLDILEAKLSGHL